MCTVQIQSVCVKFACTKKLFNLWAEVIINARNARLCARCAIFLLKNKQTPFSCRLFKGFYFLKESRKSIQDVIGEVYSPGEYCLNREKCDSLGGYVTSPRLIYACGKCGAWSFVHKVLFMLQEHVKKTKTDKTRFFFPEKRWNWSPTDNYYILPHFNQPKTEKNNCVWTTKYKRLLEMCFVQHAEMKTVSTFQTIKRLFSTTVKSAEPAATFRIFLLRTNNRQ